MTEKNPFTILGFVASVFKDLSDQNIRDLVKSQHRALVIIHHPDKGGNPERFKEIQDAFDRLKEDFEFDLCKKIFLRSRKDNIAELEKTARNATKQAMELQKSLIDFWIAFCQGGQLFYHKSLIALGQNFKILGDYEGFSVFYPPPMSVIVSDKFETHVRDVALGEQQKYLPWDLPKNDFELRISKEGILTRQSLIKITFDPQCDQLPRIRKELISINISSPSRSFYWKTEGESVALNGKLLGWLPKKCLSDRLMRDDYPQIGGLVPTHSTEINYQRVHHGFALHEFENYFRFIEPMVKNHNLVVYVECNPDLRFKILGQVRKILDPEK